MSNNFLIHCFFNLNYLNIQILYENVVKLYKKKTILGGHKNSNFDNSNTLKNFLMPQLKSNVY